MDGGRDTEIAMGGYQPHHLAAGKQRGTGEIYGFRLALWHEHLGGHHPSFLKPESLECVGIINQIAEQNWASYASETLEGDLLGHLLSYPIVVDKDDGSISALPDNGLFPDTKAHILGTPRHQLPYFLTT